MAIRKLPSTGDMPRSTGVPESLVPGGSADSAGFPWEGRTFEHHGTDFADDDGSTPQPYLCAIRALRAAAGGADPRALAERLSEALTALAGSRVLVPLLAEAGDTGLTPDGRVVEKSQELSIVTVAAPDGRRVMPVFSSVATMREWNPQARPIPVPAPQAAVAAGQEETDLIIVDPGTPELEFGVRRTQLPALALAEPCVPAWYDPAVRQAFAASVAHDVRIDSLAVAPADPEQRLLDPEVDVMLAPAAGVGQREFGATLTELQQRWAADAVIAERVDSLRISVRSC